jgi:endonuclease III-like uncharacterized protein
MGMDKEEQIRAYYYRLFQAWGPQHWWPARTRFEVMVGAYLTQNTSWTNVERALRRLRSAGLHRSVRLVISGRKPNGYRGLWPSWTIITAVR